MPRQTSSKPPQGDLIDDSDLPIKIKEKSLHLFEFTSFDMLILFVIMSAFLACFSPFNVRTVMVLCLNLGLLFIVRIFHRPAIYKWAVCLSITLYALIVTTQSNSETATINFFWPIPFIFLLTGVRFIALCGIPVFIFVVHILYVAFTDALYFTRDTRINSLISDIVLFLIMFYTGIAIYMLFFVLGQTTAFLNTFPSRSLEAIPSLGASELLTYAQVPFGLTFGRKNIMSEEQHLMILLRLAQYSPYRDLLLQLMRPTGQEIDNALDLSRTRIDRTKLVIGQDLQSTSSTSSVGLCTQVKSRRGKVNFAADPTMSKRRSGFRTKFHTRLSLADSEAHLDDDIDQEFTDVRTFLRSALCQSILESHINKAICDSILSGRSFRCSQQQIQVALNSYCAKKFFNQFNGIYSPRIKANKVIMPLWDSLSTSQHDMFPKNYQELLVPELLSFIESITEFEEPHHRADVTKGITNVLYSYNLPSHRRTSFRSSPIEAKKEPIEPQGSSVTLANEPIRISLISTAAKSFEPHWKQKSSTTTFRRRSGSVAKSLNFGEMVTVLKELKPPEAGTKQSEESLYSLIKPTRCTTKIKPSLLIAILGLRNTQMNWISKDQFGFSDAYYEAMEFKDKKQETKNINSENEALNEPVNGLPKKKSETQISSESKKKQLKKQNNFSRFIATRPKTKEKIKTQQPKDRDTCEIGTWQMIQHCMSTLFTFRLLTPTKLGYDDFLIPPRTLIGSFTDLKVERWFLTWSSYIIAFKIVKMRPTFIFLTFISISLTLIEIALHFLIAGGQLFADTGERALFGISVWLCSLQILVSIRIFCQIRPINLKNHSSCHLFKLRVTMLAVIIVALSIVDYFISPSSTIFHVDELTDIQIIYLISLKSLKEVNLHCSLIIFPLFCLCSEKSMSYCILVTWIIIFIIAPISSYLLGTWPIGTVGSTQNPQLDLMFGPTTNQMEEATSRAEAFWSHYFVLMHQFAPALILQFFITRAVQGTLRRIFGRHAFVYLLYIDALAPIEGVEKDLSSESEAESVKPISFGTVNDID